MGTRRYQNLSLCVEKYFTSECMQPASEIIVFNTSQLRRETLYLQAAMYSNVQFMI